MHEFLKNQILNPCWIILVLYAIISFIFLTIFVWRASFLWGFGPDVTDCVSLLIFALVLGLFIAIYLDQMNLWKLKWYFVISILQLIIIYFLSFPITELQLESSYEKANLIFEPLDEYKQKFGDYPVSLKQMEKALEISVPKHTNIGTRYWYEKEEGQNYILTFIAYYGYNAYYYSETGEWVLAD